MAVYAVSDLHGCLKAWEIVKEKILKPEDKIFVLGDCTDRGPQPWETFKQVVSDPRALVLKGNHEDMLVKAAKEIIDDEWGSRNQRLLASNGGGKTLDQLIVDDMPEEWVKYLQNLPTYTQYTNVNGQQIFLCHAGCTDPYGCGLPSDEDLIWDREHYFDHPKFCGDAIVVHGHTWVNYIKEDLNIKNTENEILFYANNKKICIDLGTYHTGKVGILNLDTFETVYFNI